ncbi:hypothetical protein C8Q80DRAFT_1114475 [Daedaleopsis nitida]|nr:hypothetical protein C8Q80DRAFT_1114475 [Daedaleopsis nitida]
MSEDELGSLAAPDWLQHHPEIRARNIVLDVLLKPYCVWRTDARQQISQYAVKIIPRDGRQEADIYDHLHQLNPASPNHTLPCDVIHNGREGEDPFLIMPCLEKILFGPERRKWGLRPLLNFFQQVVEGIEFLHQLHIAHIDMYNGQVMIATEKQVVFHSQLEAGKVYIIDFGTAQCLQNPPGRQPAIELPECNCDPPLGMTRFDPYSWDIYCTGMMFRSMAAQVAQFSKRPVPWVVRRYSDWLIGEERGCTGVCRCRPSARRARQVLCILVWAVRVWDACTKGVSFVQNLLKLPAARFAS